MQKKNFKSYKTVIVSSFIFILGFLAINIIYFDANRDVFKNKLFYSILPAAAEYVSSYIEEFNSKYAVLSKVIASDIDPYQFYTNGKENPDKIISFLGSTKDKSGAKTAGYVSFLTNTYYDSSGTVFEIDYDSERDYWINEFLRKSEDTKSTFYDPEDKHHLFAIYNDVKIYDDEGNAVALFGLGVPFASFSEHIENAGEKKVIYFTDVSGNIKSPPEFRGSNIYDRYNINKSEYKLSSFNTKQYEKIITMNKEGKRVVLYSEYISLLNKFLLLEIDITRIYNDLRNQVLSSFLAGLLLSAAIITGNIYLINYSSRKHLSKAYRDPLTGSYNRRYLEYCFSGNKKVCLTGKKSLITFDIDNFKDINDERGHLAGDIILKTTVSIAQSKIRDDDAVIRWGGDEFVVLVNADIDAACKIAERIKDDLVSSTGVSLTAGVTEFDKDDHFESAMERADNALYKAKNDGRNRVYSA